MIIPFDLTGKTDTEILKGYLDLGFDQPTAEAYVSVLRGDGGQPPAPVAKTSWVMTTESVRELAESVGHDALLTEVAKAAANDVAFIRVGTSDDGDVTLAAPTGVMVAFFLPEWTDLRVEGGITDPHITLAYIGDVSDLSLNQTRQLVGIVNEVAARHTTLRGVVKGTGYFSESGAWYAVPYVPGLVELHDDLVASLKAAGIPVSEEHDFTPHITLAYTANPPAVDVAPFEIAISRLTAAVGSYRYDATIPEAETDGYEPLVPYDEERRTPFVPFAKAVEEKRFTLAPMYVPGQYDAHGDWADPDELQQAVWKFGRGTKTIALQHAPEKGAKGEAVEMMVIPWEHTVPMFQADGSSQDVTFPAGTPWLGVIWDEQTWPLVKSGKVRGYSIGGRANLLNVELPEA